MMSSFQQFKSNTSNLVVATKCREQYKLKKGMNTFKKEFMQKRVRSQNKTAGCKYRSITV